jgi:hypothetical protein
MFKMVGVAERSTVVFALMGYLESLRMLKGKSVEVAGVKGINVAQETARVQEMLQEYRNNFVYVSDEIYDRTRLYVEGAEKQPSFIALLTELAALVNRGVVVERYEEGYKDATVDIDGTNRLREIVNTLNAGGEPHVAFDENGVLDDHTKPRSLDSDIAEDRH